MAIFAVIFIILSTSNDSIIYREYPSGEWKFTFLERFCGIEVRTVRPISIGPAEIWWSIWKVSLSSLRIYIGASISDSRSQSRRLPYTRSCARICTARRFTASEAARISRRSLGRFVIFKRTPREKNEHRMRACRACIRHFESNLCRLICAPSVIALGNAIISKNGQRKTN